MTADSPIATPDLVAAKSVLDLAHEVVDRATRHLAATGSVDEQQVVAYDLAHAAAAVGTGRAMLTYGEKGDTEAAMACAFVADAVADLATKVYGREAEWGVDPGALDDARVFVSSFRAPDFVAALAGDAGPRHLDADFEWWVGIPEHDARDHVARRRSSVDEVFLDLKRQICELADVGLGKEVARMEVSQRIENPRDRAVECLIWPSFRTDEPRQPGLEQPQLLERIHSVHRDLEREVHIILLEHQERLIDDHASFGGFELVFLDHGPEGPQRQRRRLGRIRYRQGRPCIARYRHDVCSSDADRRRRSGRT